MGACENCGGSGWITWQEPRPWGSTIAYETVGDLCEALPEGACHECGELNVVDDNGTCQECGATRQPA